jgi:hypothetical protein
MVNMDILTDDEKQQAVLEILPPRLPIGRAPRWDDLTEPEKASATKSWLEKRSKAGERGKTGLTPEQMERVGVAVWDALTSELPGMVDTCLKQLLPELIEPRIRDVVAQSEVGVASSIEAAMAASEAATQAIGRAGGGATDDGALVALRKDIDELKTTTLASFERRLSRHSDHLASLESKMKALSR